MITFGHDVRFSMLFEAGFFASHKIRFKFYPLQPADREDRRGALIPSFNAPEEKLETKADPGLRKALDSPGQNANSKFNLQAIYGFHSQREDLCGYFIRAIIDTPLLLYLARQR